MFIGYGLNEFQLLESIFEVGGKKTGQMFIIEGFFDYEKPTASAKNMYYRSLNIELLAYSRNDRNYSQLTDTLESWLSDLNKTGSLKGDTYKKAIEIVNEPVTEELKNQLIQLLKNEPPSMVSSIMEQLIKTPYGDEWLISFSDMLLGVR